MTRTRSRLSTSRTAATTISTARRRTTLAATAAGAALALALTGCATSGTASQGGTGISTGSAEARTVDTVLGPVTVPAEIESVVVIEGRRDLDIALSLGLPVVGFPYLEEGRADLPSPLAAATYAAIADGAQNLFLDDEVNIEAIAAAAPSLIISRSDDVEPILAELNTIAPVLAIGEQDVSTWQSDLLLVAEATGTSGKAEELIAEYDSRVAEISEKYADVIATKKVVPLSSDADGSQVRPNRLLSTVLRDVGATPSEAFAASITADDAVSFGPEQLFDGYKDADGIIALVNASDVWAETQANPLWQQLPAVQAGNVVRSDRATHEGGAITALASLDVVEALYATF